MSDIYETNEILLRGVSFCRICNSRELRLVLSLGVSPMANNLPGSVSEVNEPKYPLDLRICSICNLGQIGEFESPEEIFSDYPYLSSTSTYWLNHNSEFASRVVTEEVLSGEDLVLEIASNDGYLLRKFKSLGVPVLGIEPAKNIASYANEIGIETKAMFFGEETAQELTLMGVKPRIIIANNVAAHVPDINDFFAGLSHLSNENTLISIENPSLGHLLENRYFDTIYHEHFSYLTVDSVEYVAEIHGLELFRVEELPTHGGSLRYWLRKKGEARIEESVSLVREDEKNRGVGSVEQEEDFSRECRQSLAALKKWVETADDNSLIGYGAAAKTVTMFHAANLNPKKFHKIVDGSALKQGKRLPGTNLEIVSPEKIETNAKKFLIFPWNLESEISGIIRKLDENAEIWISNPLRKNHD